MTEPCKCPNPNTDCQRAGMPMVGRLYELCSGRCPSERPCRDGLSERYRAAWDEAKRQRTWWHRATEWFSKVFRFGRAVTKHVAHGMPKTTEEVYASRRALCDACNRRDPATDACTLCKCPLSRKLFNKLRMAKESCPLGKW